MKYCSNDSNNLVISNISAINYRHTSYSAGIAFELKDVAFGLISYDPDKENCNSLQNTLIKKAGGIPILDLDILQNKDIPGFNHTMDEKYFE